MSTSARPADLAALTLRLQTQLHLKPHTAVRISNLLSDDAASLLREPAADLARTVERAGAHIQAGDLFSPMRTSSVSASSTKPLRRTLDAAATRTIGDARIAAGTSARKIVNPLVGDTLLASLPAAPKRRKSKEDVWAELSRVDAAAAIKEAAARKQLTAEARSRYEAGLAAQLQEAKAARAAAAARETAYAASIDAATAEFKRQQADAAASLAVAAAATAAEARLVNAEIAAEREAAHARRLQEERAQLARMHAAEAAARDRAAAHKREETAVLRRRQQDNEAELAAKRAAAAAQREADAKMLADAAAVQEARERQRAADVAAREAALRAKLDSMREIFVSGAAAEAEAQVRADRERLAYERRQDEEAASRVARSLKLKAAIRGNLASQAHERVARIEAARAERVEALAVAERKRREFLADERARAEGKMAVAAAQKEALERQILADYSRSIRPDETPLDRALNASVLAGRAKPLSVTSSLVIPPGGAAVRPEGLAGSLGALSPGAGRR